MRYYKEIKEVPKDAPDADELEYLSWFRCNADFGPAHGDVVGYMDQIFESETGKRVPTGWRNDEE